MNTDVRWIRYRGPAIDDAECARVRETELFKIGDTILVWVNEGDIIRQTNMDPPDQPVKLCGTCRRSGVRECWDKDCDFRTREVS